VSLVRVTMSRRVRALRLHTAQDERSAGERRRQQLSGLAQKAQQDAAAREALVACVGNIERQLASIPGLVTGNLEEVSDLATEIGLAVAREVVGSALEQGLVDTTAVVRRCLDHAVGGPGVSQLRVRLSPDDLSTVVQSLDEHADIRARMQQVEFLPDPSLAHGRVRVETDAGRLAYDPEEVLARISQELRGAMREAKGAS